MKIISNINVPETIEEAKTMTYQQLKEACKVFNNNGLSGEDAQKAWDKNWWEGFEACLEMVLNHLDNTDPHTLPITLKDEIEEAADLYRKDG